MNAVFAEIDVLEVTVHRRLLGRVRGFRLLAFGGGLVLQGQAASYYEKQLAQHAVMEATPTPIVANEIEVGPTPCPLQDV